MSHLKIHCHLNSDALWVYLTCHGLKIMPGEWWHCPVSLLSWPQNWMANTAFTSIKYREWNKQCWS